MQSPFSSNFCSLSSKSLKINGEEHMIDEVVDSRTSREILFSIRLSIEQSKFESLLTLQLINGLIQRSLLFQCDDSKKMTYYSDDESCFKEI